MACQKVHKQVRVNIQSPFPTSLLFCEKMHAGMDEALYILSFLVCVIFGTPFLHLFSLLMKRDVGM